MQPKLDRVAFSLFGIEIMWYAILISLGILLAIILADREAKRRGFNRDTLSDILLIAIPIGFLGARVYYVIFSWDYYKDHLIQILNIRGGGLAIYGGLIAAFLAAWIACKKKKVSFIEVADITAPSIAIAQAIGRWGNYINQEAHGTPTDLPWAVIINGVKYHPTFLYESIGNFFIFLFLYWYARKRQKVSGEIISLYVLLYGVLRFFVEGLRTDSLYFMQFRVSQLVSILGIVAGAIGLYLAHKKRVKHKV